jgi:formamidopyrimidine-DNA glycosylase
VPELPETETIARDLDEVLPGLEIEAVELIRRDVLRGGLARVFASRLVGQSFTRVWRRAKTVVMSLSGGDHLLVTPRFTGSLQFNVPADQYVTLRWQLAGRGVLAYRDVRRLGTVTLADQEMFDEFDRSLGIEPLSTGFTGAALSGIVRATRMPIKKTLMEQRRLAGVGNIYANEALWRAAIDPSRASASLTPDDCDRLVLELRGVLTDGIAARGTTFRDYRDSRNEPGSFARQLRAYGRGGEPCARCGTRLTETHALDGRSTVFCHRCQH